jgi:hypothetical protein
LNLKKILINLIPLRLNMPRKKAKVTRKTKTPIRLLNVAQGVLIGNVLTEGAFRTNLWEFFTGRIDGKFQPGSDGQANITLPEILGFGSGGAFGLGMKATNTFGDVLRVNLMRPGVIPSMVGVSLLAPLAFRVGKRQLGPVIRPMNRALKQAGVKEVAL